MANKQDIEKREKQEVRHPEGTEHTREGRMFVPRADIYETAAAVRIVANMAGVDEKSVDITLEKNVLTIRGHVAPQVPEGMSPVYCEYAVGDYERSFVLSEEIDRDGIEAKVSAGVLDLTLPKCKAAQSRRIPIKAA